MVSFRQVSPPKPCLHFSPLYLPHAPSISASFSITIYLASNTSNEVSYYGIFSPLSCYFPTKIISSASYSRKQIDWTAARLKFAQQFPPHNLNNCVCLTKNVSCITLTVEHNYISSSSTVGIQLHVSALHVGHLQAVI